MIISLHQKEREEAKKKRVFLVEPHILGAANALLKRKSQAAILFYCILSRTYRSERIEGFLEFKLRKKLYNAEPDGKRKFTCLTRLQWMTATGLTKTQYDKAILFLKEQNVVEFELLGTRLGGSCWSHHTLNFLNEFQIMF